MEEIFSKARFSRESNQHMVSFRDFEKIKEKWKPSEIYTFLKTELHESL